VEDKEGKIQHSGEGKGKKTGLPIREREKEAIHLREERIPGFFRQVSGGKERKFPFSCPEW